MSKIKKWHTGRIHTYNLIDQNKPFAFPFLTRIFKYDEMMSHYDNMDHFNLITIILSNRIINADNYRDKREIDFIEKFYKKFFNDEKAKSALFLLQQYFTNKNIEVYYDDFLLEIRSKIKRQYRIQLIYYMFELADADDKIENSELTQLFKIARGIGITKKELNQISALYISGYIPFTKIDDRKYGTNHKRKKRKQKTTRSKRRLVSSTYKLTICLQVLGLNLNSTIPQIKAAYRKLVKENHPDLFASLGQLHVKNATGKMARINRAYEYIQRVRKFS